MGDQGTGASPVSILPGRSVLVVGGDAKTLSIVDARDDAVRATL
jgi:hypothetical protein